MGEQHHQVLKDPNGVIAEARSKLKSESTALKAQLRREQLKVQSLDKNLDQKVSWGFSIQSTAYRTESSMNGSCRIYVVILT